MGAATARAIVRAAAAVITDKGMRQRYREQWLADVAGATELGLSPLAVATGAAVAAVRLGVGLPGVSGRARRAFGVGQLVLAAPALAAWAFYWFARARLGLTQEALFADMHDPKDLLAPPFGSASALLALGSQLWVGSALLAPVGLVLGAGGRGAERRLPWAGALAGLAAVAIAGGDFGQALRTWLLD